MKKIRNWILTKIVPIFVILVIWETMSHQSSLSIVIPGIGETLWSFIEIEKDLRPDMLVTLQEVLFGFSIVAIGGVFLGILLGSIPFLGNVFEPIILYMNSVPKVIFFPIFLILFGIGYSSKVALGVSFAIILVVINTMVGVREVNPTFVKVARSMRATRMEIYLKIFLPSIIMPVFSGLRMGLSWTIVGTFIGELYASNAGLGHMVTRYYAVMATDRMFAIILLVAVVIFVVNNLIKHFENTLTLYY